jgi:drug/metabolite transporter (DMT)-like permease
LANDSARIDPTRPDAITLVSFAIMVVLVAGNVVAVRLSNRELPPFWGAGTRFAAASFLFFLYVWIRRIPLPGGADLRVTVLYGLLQFGIGFGLAYWSLQEVPAGLASVILASIPLFTYLFAFTLRLEPLRLQGLAGSILALAGIAVMFWERAGKTIPPAYLLAAVGFSAVFALGPVVVKASRPVHLAARNAIGMAVGTVVLLAASLISQEPALIPRDAATWATYIYLVLAGSVGLFGLLLFVLERWTASALSYQTVLSPIVAIALSAWLLDEPVSGGLVLGGALVLSGVYFGTRPQATRDL